MQVEVAFARFQGEGRSGIAATWGFFSGRFQFSIVSWRLRSTVSLPAGAGFVIVEPAPIVASSPTDTGATSIVPEPMNAPSPISVRCLFTPS